MRKLTYDYKKIWTKTENNNLEYKEWFIFNFTMEEPLNNKINSLINQEYNNFQSNNNIPPKITKLNKEKTSSFNDSSFNDENKFSYTDKVCISLQDNELTYNNYLQRELINYDYVSFTAEIIINIHYKNDKEECYIYRFDEKQKAYDTFGFSIKYQINNLQPHLKKFNIKTKPENSTLLIPTKNFNNFITLFQQDILTEKYLLFENPNKEIKKHLFEQLNKLDKSITQDDMKNLKLI